MNVNEIDECMNPTRVWMSMVYLRIKRPCEQIYPVESNVDVWTNCVSRLKMY